MLLLSMIIMVTVVVVVPGLLFARTLVLDVLSIFKSWKETTTAVSEQVITLQMSCDHLHLLDLLFAVVFFELFAFLA